MSDTLKTVLNGIPSFLWKDGEQPDATKFSTLFGSFSSAFNVISNIIGPAVNSSVSVSTLDTNVSAGKYYKDMSGSDRIFFLSNLNETILSTFNVARVIGPHAVLNPQYLPGSSHTKDSLGSGYPLATGTKIQQLPFPPEANYDWEILDGDGDEWFEALSKENLLGRLEEKFFFLDADGVLYSNQSFPANSYIKYDLYIPNTYSYLGAGYNCIPDLSILSLDNEDRLCLEVSHDSSSGAYSRWLVKLPEIITVRDPLLTTSTKEISSNSYEPVGEYSASLEKRFYTLNTDIYPNSGSPSVIDGNLLALYDFENQQTYVIDGWEVATGEDDDVIRSYYFTGPKSLEQIFRNDASGLLASGGFSTRNFFLFCLGSNISQQLAQVSLNFSKHKHNGYDSYRVSHKDLLDSENNKQGIGPQNGTSGGLDFIAYNRQLALSDSQDNVHAQYMNRLGFLFGGSHGKYEGIGSFDKLVDLNAMHGDLLFYPIENVVNSYKYSNLTDYQTALGDGDTIEKISWDLVGDPTYKLAYAFPYYRTHATVFGWPNIVGAESYSFGATKLYYEPWNFLVETEWDNRGSAWKLSRHGFVPGDQTGLSGNAKGRGLSINWGNLFFGYREDIFGGLLTGNDRTEASTYWRVGEFNIVTTANGRAGLNTNSSSKLGYTYRDGFSVKAMKGSNIWLSVGGDENATDILSSSNNPGSFALDISRKGSSTDDQQQPQAIRAGVGYENAAAGAGILATPSLRSDGKIPWVNPSDNDQTIASLWNNTQISNTISGPYILNSALDIFNLAVDYQKDNVNAFPIVPGTDDSMLSWTAGRPFIRGTYGINFCVSNNLGDLDQALFKVGFANKVDGEEWGAENVILKVGNTSEYIHREFKFWGSNTEINPSASSDSLDNTIGGNINLLYNFRRDYKRFGLEKTWSSINGSLSGGVGGVSPWANARYISLGSSKPEDYGSAIRQASYVEAFAGFRNDPYQPYTADYVLPFEANYEIGKIEDFDDGGIDVNRIITKNTLIIGQQYGATSGTLPPSLALVDSVLFTSGTDSYNDSAYYKILTTKYTFNDISLDGLIRGSEEILISKSDDTLSADGRFPTSLVDFNMKLNYFIGEAETGEDPLMGDTPHEYETGASSGFSMFYRRVVNGGVTMVPAYKKVMVVPPTGNGNRLTKIPIVMTDNNNPYPVQGSHNNGNRNSIVGYSAAIGLWPAINNATNWHSKFPLFRDRYRNNSSTATFMDNKMFVALLNIQDRLDDPASYMHNSPVPYRIYVDRGGVWLSVSGTMNFKMITTYHKKPTFYLE